MVMSKERTLTQSSERPLKAFQIFASVGVIDFQNILTYSGLGLIRVIRNIHKMSGMEKEHVFARIKSGILTVWEKM